jgi:Arc/MetJ-type ribon-helix-helix transcriptional regulator
VYALGGEMPKTKRKAVPRVTIRIAKSIMDEADRIVRESGLYFNRQQFIESAIRERIEKSKLAEEMGDDFAARIKDTFLAHAIVNTVKEKTLPANHLDLKQLERYIRRFISKSAEREGKGITRERLDELTEELLEYHKEILKGLSLMAPH